MKTAFLLVLLAISVSAADPVHLGVITPAHGILLVSNTQLTNWVRFEIELRSHSATNVIAFHMTNNILRLPRLSELPEGIATLKLKSMCNGNMVSETTVYTIDIQRTLPPTPKAMIINLPPLPPRVPMATDVSPMPGGFGALYNERSRKGER